MTRGASALPLVYAAMLSACGAESPPPCACTDASTDTGSIPDARGDGRADAAPPDPIDSCTLAVREVATLDIAPDRRASFEARNDHAVFAHVARAPAAARDEIVVERVLLAGARDPAAIVPPASGATTEITSVAVARDVTGYVVAYGEHALSDDGLRRGRVRLAFLDDRGAAMDVDHPLVAEVERRIEDVFVAPRPGGGLSLAWSSARSAGAPIESWTATRASAASPFTIVHAPGERVAALDSDDVRVVRDDEDVGAMVWNGNRLPLAAITSVAPDVGLSADASAGLVHFRRSTSVTEGTHGAFATPALPSGLGATFPIAPPAFDVHALDGVRFRDGFALVYGGVDLAADELSTRLVFVVSGGLAFDPIPLEAEGDGLVRVAGTPDGNLVVAARAADGVRIWFIECGGST